MAEEQKPSEKLLKDVAAFDKSALKDVDEKEMTPSQARDMTMAGIQNIRPGSLSHVETVEKSILPSKEDIEAEKKAAKE